MVQEQSVMEWETFVGRTCVYIEDGVFSLARVRSIDSTAEHFGAMLEALPASPLICHFRERPPRFETALPYGAQWQISQAWEHFYVSQESWDGSLYMGFRAIFAPAVVAQFRNRDLSWIDDYF